MCHGAPVAAFPAPLAGIPVSGEVHGYAYGRADARHCIAVLPDIYGCTPFYQGLCRHLAERDAHVILVNPFHEFGPLREPSREAAFLRRHRLQDKNFVDAFQRFADRQEITGVLGFCLGGLYVFELARRGMAAALVGLYGFPAGMPNQDPLPIPFDYLPEVTTPFTMLMGETDMSVGPDLIARLEAMKESVPAMSLTTYPGVGHGFLPMLDSSDPHEREVARDALARVRSALFGTGLSKERQRG